MGETAARRQAGPEFQLGAGAPPKRARKTGGGPVELVGLVPMSRKVYTSFSIDEVHRTALETHAWARKQGGITNKFDLSTVLRDVLDFWMANEEEVGAWLKKRNNKAAQGKR